MQNKTDTDTHFKNLDRILGKPDKNAGPDEIDAAIVKSYIKAGMEGIKPFPSPRPK